MGDLVLLCGIVGAEVFARTARLAPETRFPPILRDPVERGGGLSMACAGLTPGGQRA